MFADDGFHFVQGVDETFSMFDKPRSFSMFQKALGPPPDDTEPLFDHLIQHFRAGDTIGNIDIVSNTPVNEVDYRQSNPNEAEVIRLRLSARARLSTWSLIALFWLIFFCRRKLRNGPQMNSLSSMKLSGFALWLSIYRRMG